jgi:exodeoxyribonuclease VII large subunit
VQEERLKLEQLRQKNFLRVDGFITNQLAMLQQIVSRPILANPYTFIEIHESEITQLSEQMHFQIDNLLSREAMQIGHLKQQVRSLSPQSTLDRGYAVLRDLDGHVISDAKKVKSGQQLKVRLAKGEIDVASK